MILSVDGVSSGYDTGTVLRDVSINLDKGEIVGVIGRNGAGKSTLMRTIIGLLPARAGTIRFADQELTKLRAEERARRGLGYVPQGRQIFPRLTVHENLRTGRFVGGGKALDFDLIYATFPVLRERARQMAGTMSGGQQEMLSIARALIGGPSLLLLDEPSDGVQPSIVQEIGEALLTLNRSQGLSVLIVEQNLDLMQHVAQRAYVLDKGAIVSTLGQEQVQDEALLAEYLSI
ncbi:MAG TPA: ABC transporter ATP-binding protein [Acidisoma sp.]|jgi:branched-chain amino acid transport system ATP-binding protein|uniref:ABC transporter ATP-binding protein n=1 Tax=Acidisoma sp. TaxID=1872115 RepID=UPI002BE64D14|nr:ABC transporter ATP-binding protein [Acidisoma sp.]HTI00532.1 ABC transporter ATP-binding protein [Acidisoma sp.]